MKTPAIDLVLGRLEDPRPSGPNQWLAACPHHEDRHPSLGVGIGDDGRVLLTCRAGCETKDVVSALGLEMAHLFDDGPDPDKLPPLQKRRVQRDRLPAQPPEALPTEAEIRKWNRDLMGSEAGLQRAHELKGWSKEALERLEVGLNNKRLCFPIRDAHGGLVNVIKYKSSPNEGESKSLALRGCERNLFPSPESIDGDELWLVEGEGDAVAGASLALDAVAVPGAMNWKSTYAARFHGRTVVICMDCDSKGRQLAEKIAADFSEHEVEHRVVDLDPSRTDGFDLSDYLKAAPTVEQARADLLRLAGGAEPETSTLTSFEEIVAKPVRFLWQDRIPLGKFTSLSGRPKIGKGLFYSRLIADVTNGVLPGALSGPAKAILLTTEDEPGDTLKPRLMAAGANLSMVSMFQMGSKDDPVPFRVPQDADELARRVAETGAKLVVIDPMMEFLDDKTDSNNSKQTRHALITVNEIARSTGCAVLTIFHLNKGASSDAFLRHEGSAAFTQIIRSGLTLGFDPEDPEGEQGDRRVLAVNSSNLAKLATSLVFQISGKVVDGDTGEPIVTAAMDHVGESTATSSELLGSREDEEARAERDEAIEFFCAELEDGAKPSSEIKSRARSLGITEHAEKKAKKKLGVRSEKQGLDKWVLYLPTEDEPEDCATENSPSSPSSHSRAESTHHLQSQISEDGGSGSNGNGTEVEEPNTQEALATGSNDFASELEQIAAAGGPAK